MAWEEREGTHIAKLMGAMRGSRQTSPIWTQDQAATTMGVKRALVPQYVAAACNAGALFRRTVQTGIELSLEPFQAPAPAAVASVEVPRFIPPQMKAPRAGSEHPRLLSTTPRPAPLGSVAPRGIEPTGPAEAAADAQVVASTPPAPIMGSVGVAAGGTDEIPRVTGEIRVFDAEPEVIEEAAVDEESAPEFDYCTWRNGKVQIWGAVVAEDGSFVLTQEQLEEIVNGGPRP